MHRYWKKRTYAEYVTGIHRIITGRERRWTFTCMASMHRAMKAFGGVEGMTFVPKAARRLTSSCESAGSPVLRFTSKWPMSPSTPSYSARACERSSFVRRLISSTSCSDVTPNFRSGSTVAPPPLLPGAPAAVFLEPAIFV